MRLSLQVQYAICGVFDLAYNSHGTPVQIRVISDRQAIPTRYLEQIFQRLRRADLVVSKRGPGGGYTLARDPGGITLRQVVEAVEGPLAVALEMASPGEGNSTLARPNFLWTQLAESFAAVLEATSLEDVCREASRASVPRANSDAPMYFI